MSELAADATLNVRIFYEDTDTSGVVYHANYLKYFERARTLWMEARGLTHRALAEDHGVAFTLTDARLSFKAPARLDDVVTVRTRVAERRRVRIVFDQRIHHARNLLIKAQFTVVCVRLRGFKPCALPDALS